MIGSGTLTKQIAGYLARTGYEALNDDALRATKDHILYTLGTILAGSSAPGIKQALAGARAPSGGSQESTVLVVLGRSPEKKTHMTRRFIFQFMLNAVIPFFDLYGGRRRRAFLSSQNSSGCRRVRGRRRERHCRSLDDASLIAAYSRQPYHHHREHAGRGRDHRRQLRS